MTAGKQSNRNITASPIYHEREKKSTPIFFRWKREMILKGCRKHPFHYSDWLK